jgi:6-phosphogluconolactonase
LESVIIPRLPVSVCLLGMGDDMHIASLFPGADNLALGLAPDAPVLVPMRAPGAPEPRVTLSARILRGAMNTHIAITGQAKRAALDRARQLDSLKAPVAAVLDNAVVHWTI